MDQGVATTAARPSPLTVEAERALEAVGDPILIVARSGSVAYANAPARQLLTQVDSARLHIAGKASTAFLTRARATRTPVPGVIALKRGTGCGATAATAAA